MVCQGRIWRMPEIELTQYLLCLSKAITLAMLLGFLAPFSYAGAFCPITLLSGANEQNGVMVSFINVGKLRIQRIELDCTGLRDQAHQVQGSVSHEESGLFFPQTVYEMKFTYPRGVPRVVLVSLRSVTLPDGYIWKPSRRQTCRLLKIYRGQR